MISIIMPYWNRLELLRTSLAQMAELYPNYEMEIVIADDGSKEACYLSDTYPWPIKIIYLPRKDHALNPCIPINRAVWESSGYIIVLTNPEIYHPKPILGGMLNSLTAYGAKGYIIAATWSKDHERWYAHSSITSKVNAALGRLPLPEGSGLHFCTMMYRGFYEEIGGFDETYREGQGVEDNDFLWTLKEAGAIFRMRDDLVVEHMSTGVSWPSGGIDRNSEIYRKKWSHVEGAL